MSLLENVCYDINKLFINFFLSIMNLTNCCLDMVSLFIIFSYTSTGVLLTIAASCYTYIWIFASEICSILGDMWSYSFPKFWHESKFIFSSSPIKNNGLNVLNLALEFDTSNIFNVLWDGPSAKALTELVLPINAPDRNEDVDSIIDFLLN